jgi:PAS domain S-box-containing protein
MIGSERVSWLMWSGGGLLTIFAVLLPPVVYFGLTYQRAAGSLEAEAEINAIAVTRIVSANPDLWVYEQVRLAEILARRPRSRDAERRSILTLDGHVVAESSDLLPEPFLVRGQPLLDAGVPVGRIEIARSLRPIFVSALLFGLGLLPLGVMAFITLRTVPMRAIQAGERALRRQRDAAQSYLDVAGVAFVRLDEALRVTLVNRQAEAVLGRAAVDAMGREWVATFVEPRARERVAAELSGARHGEILALEYVVLRPTGESRILAWYVTPAADEAGRPGLLLSGIDVTRQRELEQQLLHAQKLEAVGRLAGGVAHEFNNILSVIKAYGTALQQALPADSPHQPDVEEIVDAAKRAAAVARGLLAFSRRQAIQTSPVDLVTVIRSAERMLRPLLRSDITFEVTAPPEPLPVLADPVQLEQVLLNLVTNARDAISGPGRIAVTAAAERLDADQARAAGLGAPGRYARLGVADDGTGFDAVTRSRVFEPFFTTKEVGQGTGLGLSIAYGIMAQHRGAIGCESEPGHGSTFTIRLPLLDTVVPVVTMAPRVTALPGGTETVLVAEDDPALRRVLRRMLERVGYTVVEAADGLLAVTQFEAHRDRVDLVLLDVVMPGQNGRQALDRIRSMEPTVPAIFLSGHTADLGSQKDIELGPEPLLLKPVEPEEFLRAVRDRLDA